MQAKPLFPLINCSSTCAPRTGHGVRPLLPSSNTSREPAISGPAPGDGKTRQGCKCAATGQRESALSVGTPLRLGQALGLWGVWTESPETWANVQKGMSPLGVLPDLTAAGEHWQLGHKF